MPGSTSTLATIWRLAIPYFRSEDRWVGRGLLASVITMELSVVAINVMLNQWNARFYNALSERDWDAYLRELMIFSALAGSFIFIRVYQVYLDQWLQIRWRQWLTRRYLDHWLGTATHYRMQLLGDAADNPDQRIAEDVRQFIELGLGITIRVLGAIVTLASFTVILWALSSSAPLRLFGREWNIPGYLFWVALVYATIGTWITHKVGKALIQLNFNQQHFEANFRFDLVRVRENSEQIALLHGEPAEQERLGTRFAAIVRNFMAIMLRTRNLNFFINGYNQVSIIFPYIVVGPAYFAGNSPLGLLTQTAGAFNSVQESFSIFITLYRSLAEWRAVIERLAGFEAAIAAGEQVAVTPPVITTVPSADANEVRLTDLETRLPAGTPLVRADKLAIARKDQVLVTGPSGSGKSTLFRAIGGIWPFGSGTVMLPADARVMVLPQRPYFPVGTLAVAVAYPAVSGTFEAARVADVLVAVGLPGLVARLDEEAHWNRMLSLGEQQRLAVARAILHAPDFLFLDEATASLDEPAEAALYRLLQERLRGTTIVSIGHRSTLRAFHQRHVTLTRDGDSYRAREVQLEAAQ